MIIIKSPREINLMKEAGRVVGKVFDQLKEKIRPGISTLDIANWCEEIIRNEGAYPTFLNYSGYPGAVCVSVNDEIVHGIPSKKRILRDGDIVSVDVGATLHGYVGDACRTFPVGICKEETLQLIKITEDGFFEGMKYMKPGNRLGDVSHAIQEYCEKNGYGIVREYTGHGVGSHLHEDPYIPNYGTRGSGPLLKEGMCLAVEPMVTQGSFKIRVLSDGWTAKTKDGKLSCHYENSIVITKDGFEILTKAEGPIVVVTDEAEQLAKTKETN